MSDLKKAATAVGTGGLSLVTDVIGGAVKPKAAPKAPAPVTLEDPNVRQASELKRRRLQGSRSQSRMLSTGQAGTTLG